MARLRAVLPRKAGVMAASWRAAARSLGSSVVPTTSPADALRWSSTTGSPGSGASAASRANTVPLTSTRKRAPSTCQVTMGWRSWSVTTRRSGKATAIVVPSARAGSTAGSARSAASIEAVGRVSRLTRPLPSRPSAWRTAAVSV